MQSLAIMLSGIEFECVNVDDAIESNRHRLSDNSSQEYSFQMERHWRARAGEREKFMSVVLNVDGEMCHFGNRKII